MERALIQAMAPEPARQRMIKKGLALAGAVALGAGMLLAVSARPVRVSVPAAVAVAPVAPRPAPVMPAPAPAVAAAPGTQPPLAASAPQVELTAFPDPAESKSDPRAHEESSARHARRGRRVILDPFAE